MSNRDVVVKRLVTTKNQLHRWVEIVFPELQQVFKDITCKGAIATLRSFPTPGELCTLQPEDIVTKWRKLMKRQAGYPKARLLIDLARCSVGTQRAIDAHKLHLEQLLEEYDLATTQLGALEQKAIEILKQIPFVEKMLAIKGISPITLAGILGESGDLSGFAHGNALLRHAGLHLAEASSGKWKGQIVLSKRGRSRLRRFLFMATINLVINNPEFKAIHSTNVKMKKLKRMKSIMKLCGKLARLLVGMARNGLEYIPEKVLPVAQVAA
jgi:transposase